LLYIFSTNYFGKFCAAKIKNNDFAIVPHRYLTSLENPGGFNDLLVGFMKRNFG